MTLVFAMIFLDMTPKTKAAKAKIDIFLGVLVLEGLIGLRRTIQLQLLQHDWSGHRLGLL